MGLLALRTWLFLALTVAGIASAGPLDFDGRPAESILVTLGPEPPSRVFGAAMPNRVLGTLAVVSAPDRRRMALVSRRAESTGWPEETEVLGHVHATLEGTTRTFRVGLTPDGLVLFGSLDGDGAEALPMEACDPVINPQLGFGGLLVDEAPAPTGQALDLAPPYRASPIVLDGPTIRARLNAGRPTNLPETERYLVEERFVARLPEGYSAREPAGLLVWISPTDSASPPGAIVPVADALGLVVIAPASAGNRRLSTDRYQLGLDAVATARARFHIDSARVYVAGFSGGGRVCSTLAACFPEVFAGAVPIGGMNIYQRVPLGDGRFVQAGFGRPKGETWGLLRRRRIAPITGPLDFNHREIVHAVRIVQRDGLDVRLFEYPDLAHTLPSAERFEEALRWVDARHAAAREEAGAEAQKLLEGYLARYGEETLAEHDPESPQQKFLERIAETAPWSEPAWRACRLLGLDVPAGATPEISRTP